MRLHLLKDVRMSRRQFQFISCRYVAIPDEENHFAECILGVQKDALVHTRRGVNYKVAD